MDVAALAPELAVVTAALAVVIADLLPRPEDTSSSLRRGLLPALSLLGLAVAAALSLRLWGLTGTTDLAGIAEGLARPGTHQPALIAALVMMAAGFGFKVAAVPFQMWVPDVYEGAPIPIAGFLAVASKAGGFAVLLRVFHTAFGAAPIQSDWATLFASLSIASMVLGNVVAMQQSNIKRLMAYSSIAQAGYLLIGLATTTASGRDGVLFFLGAYAFTT